MKDGMFSSCLQIFQIELFNRFPHVWEMHVLNDKLININLIEHITEKEMQHVFAMADEQFMVLSVVLPATSLHVYYFKTVTVLNYVSLVFPIYLSFGSVFSFLTLFECRLSLQVEQRKVTSSSLM